MRTNLYIDGFNLYYRMLKENPQFKWLDLKALSVQLLQPQNWVQSVRYYTARISGRLRYSLSEVEAIRQRGEDTTRPDAPEADSLGEDFWKSARVVVPPGKTSVHLRLDRDVVDWFRARGKGHLTRMNAVLRSYVEAHKRSA